MVLSNLCRHNCPGSTLQDNGSEPSEDDPQSCLDTFPEGVAVTGGALRTAVNQKLKDLEHEGPICLVANREGGASALPSPDGWLLISGGSFRAGGSLSL